jgi:hypothetical protein
MVNSRSTTVLGLPLSERLILVAGFPVLGALLGLVLPVLSRWIVEHRVPVPMRIVFRFVASADMPWEVAIWIGAGVLLGAGVGMVGMTESTKVTLTGTGIRFDRDGATRTLARTEIAAVFFDGKRLVVLDRESRQLFNDTPQASGPRLAAGFRAHDYPWYDRDPYEALYRRWIPDSPDLPPAVNAVLRVRDEALSKKARRDADDLRAEVQKLGYVVREEGDRQYWRPLVRT